MEVTNIFLDDSSKSVTKMIYAKNGIIIDSNKQKVFQLFDGKVINKDKTKVNTFEFERIDFNLADYRSSTIIAPKIQEINSLVLLDCSYFFNFKKLNIIKPDTFKCTDLIMPEIKQEIFKRFFKPFFIPIIAILSCFLIITPKIITNMKEIKNNIFSYIFYPDYIRGIFAILNNIFFSYYVISIYTINVFFNSLCLFL